MSSSMTHTCSATRLPSDGSADSSAALITVRHHRQSASAWNPHAMLLGLVRVRVRVRVQVRAKPNPKPRAMLLYLVPFLPAHLRQVPAALTARV